MKRNPLTPSALALRAFLLASCLIVSLNSQWVVSAALDATGDSLNGNADASTKPAAVQHYNLGSDKLALSGYDPVTYFTQNKAVKGRKDIHSLHRGVNYQFSSEETRQLFAAAPEKYLPTYGGWCATAMAKGQKVEIDPTNFKVTNGRLFLFFKAFYANAIKDWNKDEANQTIQADSNWKKLSGE